jgi:hypothetical protein
MRRSEMSVYCNIEEELLCASFDSEDKLPLFTYTALAAF